MYDKILNPLSWHNAKDIPSGTSYILARNDQGDLLESDIRLAELMYRDYRVETWIISFVAGSFLNVNARY